MRRVDPRDGLRSSGSHQPSSFVASLRSEINHPIGALDDLEIVLDHDEGIARVDQALEQLHQHRDIVEMQSSGRLVENEKVAAARAVLFGAGTLVREMPDEFEALRFAARKSVQRLTKPQITKADFVQNIERIAELLGFPDLSEKLDRFTDGQLEDVVNGFLVQLHIENVRLKAAAFAFGATDVKIAQELHLDLLKAGAATALATAAAGVERERACGQPLRHRFRLGGEKLANAIVEPQVENRRRARGARQHRLIHHHDVADAMGAGHRFARARFLLGRRAFGLKQVSIKDLVNERRLPGSGNAGDAVENPQRNLDIEILEIMLPRARLF